MAALAWSREHGLLLRGSQGSRERERERERDTQRHEGYFTTLGCKEKKETFWLICLCTYQETEQVKHVDRRAKRPITPSKHLSFVDSVFTSSTTTMCIFSSNMFYIFKVTVRNLAKCVIDPPVTGGKHVSVTFCVAETRMLHVCMKVQCFVVNFRS